MFCCCAVWLLCDGCGLRVSLCWDLVRVLLELAGLGGCLGVFYWFGNWLVNSVDFGNSFWCCVLLLVMRFRLMFTGDWWLLLLVAEV